MVRVKDTKTFIQKARIKHGDKYNYDKTVYNGSAKKLTVTCPEHGDFEIQASQHVNIGGGCQKCSKIAAAEKLSSKAKEYFGRNLEDREKAFISKAVAKWGGKFDYSDMGFRSVTKEVKIKCPLHGDFYVTPDRHLYKNFPGCSGCVVEKRKADFIRSAKEMHGDRYDYSSIDFVNHHTRITVYCKNHGIHFQTTPNQHMTKYCGCSQCIREDRIRDKQEKLIKRAIKIHGDKYDYSLVEYTSQSEKVIIVCPEHGEFNQDLYGHSMGRGCPGCNRGGYKGHPNSAYGISGYYGTDNPAHLYFVKVGEEFVKVGVSKDINQRLCAIQRETNKEVSVLGTWEGSAKELFKIEQSILHKCSFKKYEPDFRFVGSTECFYLSEENNIQEYIEQKINKEIYYEQSEGAL